MYRYLLRLLESFKHTKRSKYRIVRGINHYRYVVICFLENLIVRHVDVSKCLLKQGDGVNIVCSLTTYPGRIHECFYAIKTMMLQSVTPNRIVLWLAESQFPNRELPDKYKTLINLGLEVRYCDDIRSHKKYFYMLQEQKPNELVITFDDDIIYHPDTIKRALDVHKKYPNCIVCNEAKEIVLANHSTLASYNKWRKVTDGIKAPSVYKYSIMTGSGCLYPYGIMPKQTFCVEKIKEIAFTADDLWITFTAKAFGIEVLPTEIIARNYTTISHSQSTHLAQVNCLGDGNDKTIYSMCELYPEMKEKLLKSLV